MHFINFISSSYGSFYFPDAELWLSFWSEVHYNSLYEIQGLCTMNSLLFKCQPQENFGMFTKLYFDRHGIAFSVLQLLQLNRGQRRNIGCSRGGDCCWCWYVSIPCMYSYYFISEIFFFPVIHILFSLLSLGDFIYLVHWLFLFELGLSIITNQD